MGHSDQAASSVISVMKVWLGLRRKGREGGLLLRASVPVLLFKSLLPPKTLTQLSYPQNLAKLPQLVRHAQHQPLHHRCGQHQLSNAVKRSRVRGFEVCGFA